MKIIPIIAKPDHLTSVSRSKNPLSAIAELIWNALDAEADVVEIETVENQMGGLEKIIVKDNGFGLPYEYAFTSFGSLGGSWKRDKQMTDISHRLIHGQNGRGRFQAFSIGNCCDWRFTYSENDERFQYTVSGQSSDLASFAISDDNEATSDPVGTIVTISDIRKDFPSLKRKHATLKLAEVFALFLTRYPGIRIIYDGEPISPEKAKIDTAIIKIENEIVNDSYSFDAEITIDYEEFDFENRSFDILPSEVVSSGSIFGELFISSIEIDNHGKQINTVRLLEPRFVNSQSKSEFVFSEAQSA